MADTSGARGPVPDNWAILLRQIEAVLQFGGKAAAGLSHAAVRAAMPLLEALAGLRASAVEGGDRAGAYGFTRGEIAVLTRLATKVLLESMEIASVTDPVYKGAPPYVARIDGKWQEPRLVHILALGLALNRLLSDEDDKDGGDDDPPPPAADKTVVYLSLGAGEFVAPGPMQPIEIRRMAMRQRALNPPQLAMLRRGSDPAQLVAAAQAGPAVEAGYGWPQSTGAAPAKANPAAYGRRSCGCGCDQRQGCGCGGSCGCGCEHCGRNHRFAPARLDKNGDCVAWWSVSCDTRSRIRECFKVAFCDMLRCLGDEICDENCRIVERPELKRCVETFVCTLVGCLPDAICPPREPEPACPPHEPPPASACRCNFAVGD